MIPEQTGDMTQLAMIAESPPEFQSQLRQPNPTPTAAAPTVPPTMLCVVDTGIAVKVTSIKKTAAAARLAHMATM